jgi:hypothetical protein
VERTTRRADFERMVREIESAPDAELIEVQFGEPAPDQLVAQAIEQAEGPLPEGMEALYREMNGFSCQWRISRGRTDLLPEGNAPEGDVNLLPLLGAEFAIFNDWIGLVWEEPDDPKQFVKPFDFQHETCAALYPVPGAMEVFVHELIRDLYPTGYTFARYIDRLLIARGLSSFRYQLSPTLYSEKEAEWLARVLKEIFGAKGDGQLIRPDAFGLRARSS